MTFRHIGLAFGLVIALLAGTAEGIAGERSTRAQAIILDLSSQARNILTQTGKPLALREKQLIATIGRNFHFTLIAELVVGPEWETYPQHQRQEFLDLFRDFFLRSYGSQLGGYPEDQFTILSIEEKGSRDAFVKTRLIRPNRQPVIVDWRLREILGTPLIIDLLINGTSVALSHREGFHAVLASDGMAGLITLFKIRAERLDAETRGYAAGQDLFEQGRFAEAVALWEGLAEKGDAKAQFNLSIMYADGRGVEPDSAKAEYWNDRALKAGYPPALHNHALTLLANKENEAAIALLEKSARANFARSQYTLGKIYSYGIGIPENPAHAFEYLSLAARAGIVEAQYNLGKVYRDGYGTNADASASLAWFKKAALQGYGKAQEKLATRYGSGEGVAQNDIEALKWAILATDGGVVEAAEWQKLFKGRMSKSDIARAETLARGFKPQREEP